MNEQKEEIRQQKTEEQATNNKKSGLATAGFVLGIVGVCASFIPYISNASFILGILAIIFGLVAAMDGIEKRKGKIAIALGVLAIVIAVIMRIVFAYVISAMVGSLLDTIFY